MGSEQRTRNGLSGTADGAQGYPEQFIILNVDIDPEALKARYAGTKRHEYICNIIDGAVQLQRTKRPPTPAFTRGLRRAKQIPPLAVCDLGRDGTKDGWETVEGKKRKAGLNHVLVIDGRQRDMATRENNRLDEQDHGKPARQLRCEYVTFPSTGTREAVVLFKVGANVREIRTFASRAEDAADMKRSGYSDEDIAPYVEAKDAAEVGLLLLLDGCEDEVKAAVDEGRLALADVADLSKRKPEEQARRVTLKTAPTKAARNAAVAHRATPHPRTAIKIGVTLAMSHRCEKADGFLLALRWHAGEDVWALLPAEVQSAMVDHGWGPERAKGGAT